MDKGNLLLHALGSLQSRRMMTKVVTCVATWTHSRLSCRTKNANSTAKLQITTIKSNTCEQKKKEMKSFLLNYFYIYANPQLFTRRQIFSLFKLKQIKCYSKHKFVFHRVVNMLEKGKMLITSIFSFSHNIFRRLFPEGYKKLSRCGKGLKCCTSSSSTQQF